MKTREELILQLISSIGRVYVNELSLQLDVSVETIRRDLNNLVKKGLVHRIHGGAVSPKSKDIGSSFQVRQKTNYEAKRSIAERVVEYVFEGAVIGLDASSSSWHVAQLMPNIPCTVVTNSMHNISALVNKPNIRTIATGGAYSSKYDAFYGPLSEHLLQRLHIDLCIFSCSGIDSNGDIWESNELNASIKRKMIETSGKNFLLADNSKFERKHLIKLNTLSQVNLFFTNILPSVQLQDYCKNFDITISI
ncbi:DeoR family transcriptional regulator [Bisgaardia hudsonensis]|nr:DeoR/GlpR family DNA-binding transcription regulator [Bisgaardia hudsonensis]QLB13874.1 DeoR family transcriptional regulator [Bisgaardia hudsonensis]